MAEEKERKSKEKKSKKDKKEKKEKKKHKKEHKEKESAEETVELPQETTAATSEAQSARQQRRMERKAAMDKIPETDPETGRAFTKQERRRMRKRVERGLDPIETPRERHERQVQDAELRKEEEEELLGSVVRKPIPSPEDDEDVEVDKEDEDVDDDLQDDEKEDQEEQCVPASDRKPKCKKPVPADYVCSACQAKALHWIYDCPKKVTVRGTNLKRKRDRGNNAADPAKVFISGLPFTVKAAKLKELITEKAGPVKHVKILTFEDTGRCKGQAYVTMESVQDVEKALALTGESMTQGKSITLQVTKALNRIAVKKQKRKATTN